MTYIYIFLMCIGLLSSLLGAVYLLVALFASSAGALSAGFGLLMGGLILIAFGDMGSKLSNLREDFDFFLAQQHRPPPEFLKTAPEDESE